MPRRSLTVRQRRFVAHYQVDFNATRAAGRPGVWRGHRLTHYLCPRRWECKALEADGLQNMTSGVISSAHANNT